MSGPLALAAENRFEAANKEDQVIPVDLLHFSGLKGAARSENSEEMRGPKHPSKKSPLFLLTSETPARSVRYCALFLIPSDDIFLPFRREKSCE